MNENLDLTIGETGALGLIEDMAENLRQMAENQRRQTELVEATEARRRLIDSLGLMDVAPEAITAILEALDLHGGDRAGLTPSAGLVRQLAAFQRMGVPPGRVLEMLTAYDVGDNAAEVQASLDILGVQRDNINTRAVVEGLIRHRAMFGRVHLNLLEAGGVLQDMDAAGVDVTGEIGADEWAMLPQRTLRHMVRRFLGREMTGSITTACLSDLVDGIPQIGPMLADMAEGTRKALKQFDERAARQRLDELALLHEQAAQLAAKKDTAKRRAKLAKVQEQINAKMRCPSLRELCGETDRELAEGIAGAGKVAKFGHVDVLGRSDFNVAAVKAFLSRVRDS